MTDTFTGSSDTSMNYLFLRVENISHFEYLSVKTKYTSGSAVQCTKAHTFGLLLFIFNCSYALPLGCLSFSLFVCCLGFFRFSADRGRNKGATQLTPHGESVPRPSSLSPLFWGCQTQTCLCCFIIGNLHMSRRTAKLKLKREKDVLWAFVSSTRRQLAQFDCNCNANAAGTGDRGSGIGNREGSAPQFTCPLTHVPTTWLYRYTDKK